MMIYHSGQVSHQTVNSILGFLRSTKRNESKSTGSASLSVAHNNRLNKGETILIYTIHRKKTGDKKAHIKDLTERTESLQDHVNNNQYQA